MTKTTYITKPVEAKENRKARASETFIRSPDGNKRKLGNGEFENIGRLVYCSLEEANAILNDSRKKARESGVRTTSDFFYDEIFFATQMPEGEPGGIIFYERLEEKNEEGKPKIKRSYSLVEKIEEK